LADLERRVEASRPGLTPGLDVDLLAVRRDDDDPSLAENVDRVGQLNGSDESQCRQFQLVEVRASDEVDSDN